MTERHKEIISLVDYHPEKLNFMELLNYMKLYCLKRRIAIKDNEQCYFCEINDFCHAPPAEYHLNLITHALEKILPTDQIHTDTESHS